MEFSVKLDAENMGYLSEDYWCFHDDPIGECKKQRLKLALKELVSGFNTDTPLIVTPLAKGSRKPPVGQFAKDVFWVDADRFRLSDFMVVNTSFLARCLGKYSLIESFGLIGEMVADEAVLSETLCEWDQLFGLHCFVIDLGESDV